MTDRTPEQHMADIAAATLARLAELHDELDHLRWQLDALAQWADDHDLGAHEEALETAAYHVGLLAPEVDVDRATMQVRAAHYQRTGQPMDWPVTEAIRDLAANLPIRGLDYGAETRP